MQTKIKVRYLEKHATELDTPNQKTTLDTGAVTRFGSIIPTVYFFPGMLICPILQCCGSALVSLRISIKLIFSKQIRIQIQIAKTLLKGRKLGSFVNYDQFPCCWIRIHFPNTGRIQDSQINADPDSQHGYFDP
jgi:hypothetical protein